MTLFFIIVMALIAAAVYAILIRDLIKAWKKDRQAVEREQSTVYSFARGLAGNSTPIDAWDQAFNRKNWKEM